VDHPEFFDAVVLDGERVREIQVKQADAESNWIWGAFRMSAAGFRDLHLLWKQRACRDEYFGTLVNGYIRAGGCGIGVKAGESYVDVGTLNGYRTAMALLIDAQSGGPEDRPGAAPLVSVDIKTPSPATTGGIS
jgi:glucose-1-phosphate thymidylyltransferase